MSIKEVTMWEVDGTLHKTKELAELEECLNDARESLYENGIEDATIDWLLDNQDLVSEIYAKRRLAT